MMSEKSDSEVRLSVAKIRCRSFRDSLRHFLGNGLLQDRPALTIEEARAALQRQTAPAASFQDKQPSDY